MAEPFLLFNWMIKIGFLKFYVYVVAAVNQDAVAAMPLAHLEVVCVILKHGLFCAP